MVIADPATLRSGRTTTRPRIQPRYNVVLLYDDDHTYPYVLHMLDRLFGINPQRGYRLAQEVNSSGRAILLTTTFEHAELKRDQIQAFGPDMLLIETYGSMSAVIEPVDE